ncbi:hypothetical protein Dsin_027363 [Dipteronia sinensis]|uniref:Uncharacterized protein n=1 Tax=Dipteronia sinensis TaxID=43782 RepID=A0AAD9ZNU6_9ROSI|nr:hypothetical protein Dsin_027363 [Dipteronia sinensis]
MFLQGISLVNMRPVEGTTDHVSVCIDAKLSSLPQNPPERCIFKVHYELRSVNEKAYEPEMLAIGPYHRDKNRLQVMEEHKLRYLQQLLRRRNESSVNKYVVELRGFEERARKCYADSLSLSVDKFVEMLLLDGCFIIELFRKYAILELRDINDPTFSMDWILNSVARDMMLFENQLPFFVLHRLFNMTMIPDMHYDLVDVALHFFDCALPCPISVKEGNSSYEINHLLGLIHNFILTPFAAQTGVTRDVVGKEENFGFMHSAMDLKEAGVTFKKAYGSNLFDIKFENGVMKIPCLRIEDQTESFFRNLIAYEQYREGNRLNYVTDYVTFLNYLINSSKDVELCCYGIIENWLGDHEAVSTMFNKLGDYVMVSNFCYAQIFKNVNVYCCRRWNLRLAKLRRNYFNSPWALLSFLAAVLLLMLTLIQTVVSILSYVSP